jgi:hypothetical protein
MPYAHESVNPARHTRTCAWLRAALRLLRNGLTDSPLRVPDSRRLTLPSDSRRNEQEPAYCSIAEAELSNFCRPGRRATLIRSDVAGHRQAHGPAPRGSGDLRSGKAVSRNSPMPRSFIIDTRSR